eukprot:3066038-Pyramimonas_sp.AAC.1
MTTSSCVMLEHLDYSRTRSVVSTFLSSHSAAVAWYGLLSAHQSFLSNQKRASAPAKSSQRESAHSGTVYEGSSAPGALRGLVAAIEFDRDCAGWQRHSVPSCVVCLYQLAVFANDKSLWEALFSARWSGDTRRPPQPQLRQLYVYNERVLQCLAALPVSSSLAVLPN